nr:NCK-associated protein 1 [Halisarca dujardinii]
MSRQTSGGLSLTEQKFAEKLFILNERGSGILIRLYNIKKGCQDPASKPPFLSDKSLESAIKHLVKKFPVAETKGAAALSPLSPLQKDLVAALQNSYNTFVDVMEFKDVTQEVITAMASNNIMLDISINFGVCSLLLELVALYCSVMLLLAQIEDRRALVALYNHAYDLSRGSSETNYPRLAQLIVDYDSPTKKFPEDFGAISLFISRALVSLTKLYLRRNQPAEQMRAQQVLSVSHSPNLMLQPSVSNEMAGEFLSLERINRWILLGFLTCVNRLSDPGAFDLLKHALQDGFSVSICRDETLLVHAAYEHLLSSSKDKADRKKASEVLETAGQSAQTAPAVHREKRRYLRATLNELRLLLADAPGLLGPKLVVVLTALSMARDELHWLYRHANSPAPKKQKINPADFTDSTVPELLFQVIEVRNLVLRHRRIVQTYYRKYMGNYHGAYLRDLAQQIPMAPEFESVLMSSFVDTLMRLGGKEGEAMKEFDFQPLRLDWLRMQTYISAPKSPMKITEHLRFALAMNTITTHSSFVDDIDRVLKEHVDMSFMCFYSKTLEAEFARCIAADDTQLRYVVSIAAVCPDFLLACSPHAPEERLGIGEKAINLIHQFLDTVAKEAQGLTRRLCTDRIALSSQLIPVRGVPHYLKTYPEKVKVKVDKKNPPQVVQSGLESQRKNREEQSQQDQVVVKLSNLSWSVNHYPTLSCWEHVFRPREYIITYVNELFANMIVELVKYNEDSDVIARPSEVLHKLKAFVVSIRSVEAYVNIDLTPELNQVLLQQTQPLDAQGRPTIASLYANWYVNVLLRKTSSGNIWYSPSRRCFLSRSNQTFRAEDYSDISELSALSELIGPYGVRLVGERLMEQVSSQTKEVKRLVVANKETLLNMFQNRDKPELFQEALKKLRNTDDLMTRMTIIGIVMAFRKLTLEAMRSVLARRTPFILNVITSFHDNPPPDTPEITQDIAAAAGVPCSVDPLLTRVMTLHCGELP